MPIPRKPGESFAEYLIRLGVSAPQSGAKPNTSETYKGRASATEASYTCFGSFKEGKLNPTEELHKAMYGEGAKVSNLLLMSDQITLPVPVCEKCGAAFSQYLSFYNYKSQSFNSQAICTCRQCWVGEGMPPAKHFQRKHTQDKFWTLCK